jgi:hypothetical protein
MTYYIVSKQVYTPADSHWTVWPGTEGYSEADLAEAEGDVSVLQEENGGFVFDIVNDDNVSHFTGDTLEVE